jgi:hypothetical protein
MAEARIVRARWSTSPLREAKTLLGVLQQEGLRGKGLIQAFEKNCVRYLGYTRADMAKIYRQQTGRELSDYILIQKADKVIRTKELEAEIAVLRRTLLSNRKFKRRWLSR